MSEAITFKAQLSPHQSAILVGPDGLQVKMIPLGLDGNLAAQLFDMQEKAFVMTVLDSMGNISFNASFPDTRSAIAINKTTPQFQIRIPKGDLLTGLRLVALFGIVFQVEIEANGKAVGEGKKEKKPKGEHGAFWNHLIKKNFMHNPGVFHILGEIRTEDDADPKKVLCDAFSVELRSFISPDELRNWLETMGKKYNAPIDGALVLIEQAERSM